MLAGVGQRLCDRPLITLNQLCLFLFRKRPRVRLGIFSYSFTLPNDYLLPLASLPFDWALLTLSRSYFLLPEAFLSLGAPVKDQVNGIKSSHRLPSWLFERTDVNATTYTLHIF